MNVNTPPRGVTPPVAPRQGVLKRRLYVVATLMAMGLTLLVLKSARLQLELGHDLKDLAERQYLRQLKFRAPRGTIHDRAGRPLAMSIPVWSVSADPRNVSDPLAAARALAPVLEMEADVLVEKLSSKRHFVWLARRVRPDMADSVRALKQEGVGLHEESKRFFPNRALAGQLLGTVSIDGNGQSGLERAYDQNLRGRSVRLPGLRDNRGQRAVLAEGFDLEVLKGDDVFLTVDAQLQHHTETVLAETVTRLSAKSGAAVVMDPKTGEILAIASAPLFNPNAPSTSEKGANRNHALSDAFEPGSTFKIMTFAAALDAGVVTPTSRIFCENGKAKLGRFTVRDTHPEGWLSVRDVFKYSSNIGTMKIAAEVGEATLRDYIGRFGFGQRPGLGLVGEGAGRVPAQDRWGEVRTGTISFGHGLSVTAVQLATGVSAVAAGGVKPAPTLLRRVVTATGEVVVQGGGGKTARVMSAATAHTLTEIMSSVFEPGGTGTAAKIEGVTAAGKTGTAEKVDPVTKRYSKALHVASFVGFAPADKPEAVVVVVIDEPKGSVFGGSAAGPVFKSIMTAALTERGVLRADPNATPISAVPSAPAETLKAKLNDALTVDAADANDPYVGMSAREALRTAERAGIDAQLVGHGRVVRSVEGRDAEGAMRVRLELAP